ncbi:hypothetical protein VNO77_27467 [Canavalia gladiata]|uniref:Peptidase A1 domain-containing protein n=1 Tax=Canavalia gladiata TaxID=3824 RepID=A0AAN9KYX3_CANGL
MRRTMQNGLILVTIISLTFLTVSIEGKHAMRLELVHRHDSRLTESEMNQTEAIKGFIHRDILRHQKMKGLIGPHKNRRKDYETSQQYPEMEMRSGSEYGIGEYFVEVKVGTPGKKFWLAADTGSEFTWFNCLAMQKKKKKSHHVHLHREHKGGSKSKKRTKKVKSKGKKNKNSPCKGVFCPHRSRSFHTVTCASQKCKVDLSEMFSLSYCPDPSSPCLYDISYADGSSAKGFFGTDTVTVDLTNGKRGKLRNLTIGCTRTMQNGITFNKNTGGILGLGYSKDSFVDKAALQYGAKFSYCLVDHLSPVKVSSYLTFGGLSNVTLLSEIRKTELVLVSPFYGVNVVGISVGGQMLKIPPEVWDFNALGGTIIDSGTTLTTLVDAAYDQVLEALRKPFANFKRLNVDVLEFCFDSKGFDERIVPRLAFHFAGGTKFEPPVKSYIIDAAPQVKCIGIAAMPDGGASVIGNIMQQNHLWEFDLAHNTLGMAPSTCT